MVSEGYFGSGEPNPKLLRRIGDVTLLAEQEYCIKDCVKGEHPIVQIGVHGGASTSELYVPLATVRL